MKYVLMTMIDDIFFAVEQPVWTEASTHMKTKRTLSSFSLEKSEKVIHLVLTLVKIRASKSLLLMYDRIVRFQFMMNIT